MALKEELLADLKAAMKAKDNVKKQAITMIRAAILQVEKDTKKELTDEEILDVIAKQVKQRKDALEDFVKAEREDLIEQTNKELEAIMKYMPKQLTKEELSVIVKEAIEKTGAKTKKDMGKIMKEVMPKIKGKADGKSVNEVASSMLE